MGCDIHSCAEVRQADGSWKNVGRIFPVSDKTWADIINSEFEEPFYWRSYGMFGFLADVRNYSHVPVIAEPKHALPDDVSSDTKERYGEGDWHTTTWLTLRQLLEFDYDQVFWDRRVTKQTAPNCWNGAALAEEGEGEHIKLRDFLGEHFFEHLDVLETLGAPDDVRIVFWFDN